MNGSSRVGNAKGARMIKDGHWVSSVVLPADFLRELKSRRRASAPSNSSVVGSTAGSTAGTCVCVCARACVFESACARASDMRHLGHLLTEGLRLCVRSSVNEGPLHVSARAGACCRVMMRVRV